MGTEVLLFVRHAAADRHFVALTNKEQSTSWLLRPIRLRLSQSVIYLSLSGIEFRSCVSREEYLCTNPNVNNTRCRLVITHASTTATTPSRRCPKRTPTSQDHSIDSDITDMLLSHCVRAHLFLDTGFRTAFPARSCP
jgi:hypothetical protein